MLLDLTKYKDEFISEARENLQTLNESMLELEADPSKTEALNTIFRSAHTLKGSSAMMGFEDMSKLTHSMENALDELRHGGHASPELLDILFKCIDTLEEMVNNIDQEKESSIDISPLIEALTNANKPKKVSRGKAGKKAGKNRETSSNTSSTSLCTALSEESIQIDAISSEQISKAAAAGEKCYLIRVKISEACEMKSVRAYAAQQTLKQIVHIVKSNPDPETADDATLSGGIISFIVTTSKCVDEIRSAVEMLSEISEVKIADFNTQPVQQKTPNEKQSVEAVSKEMIATVKSPAKEADEKSSVSPSLQTVRVSFERLDTLMNLVGELIINKVQLERVATQYRLEPLTRALSNISRLTTDLQDVVMQMRTVPVQHIFQRFPRLIRDISIKEEKKVNLEINGMDIEIDRAVLEEINEPLVHLLRNSMDHGIEPPAERENKGKNPVGTVKLTALRRRDHIVIEIEDDGAGIDPEKIRHTAIEKGFISQPEADQMDDDQAIKLIFLAGLSTAKKVTDISGRGVGMDVVKTKIESFGGTVTLESKVGVGTKVSLKLPLTLSVTTALLVRVSNQTYAIPVSSVQEVLPLRKEQIRSIGNSDAILLRGDVCLLLWLHDLLGLPRTTGDGLMSAVVVEGASGTVGLIVDSLLGQQEIVIKSLSESLKIRGIGGVTIMGDGQVVLILDLAPLLQTALHQSEAPPLQTK